MTNPSRAGVMLLSKRRGAGVALLLQAFLFVVSSPTTIVLLTEAAVPDTPESVPPQLGGRHFRITTIKQPGYVDVEVDEETGEKRYSGYLIEILRAVSREDRGNFTFDLLSPSGFGSDCANRLPVPVDWDEKDNYNATATSGTSVSSLLDNPQAYAEEYETQYKCGESDVNDRPLSPYSTDMYWGLFYITPKRLAVSKFSLPISPPTIGTLGMLGTATGIRSIEELANDYSFLPVCAYANTAYIEELVISFPSLDVRPIPHTKEATVAALMDGTCDIVIGAYAELQSMIPRFFLNDDMCLLNGKPVGVIGQPLSYGLNHFAFGVRTDIDDEVLGVINYWINALESCFPNDPTSVCSEENGGGSFSVMFNEEVTSANGDECGYVLFPVEEKNALHPGVIAAIVITPVVLVLALSMVYHMHQLKKQEKRMKKRFIQQLARNIEIGESARDIPAETLTDAFKHIGGNDGMISKQDLAKWLNDLHMEFMSERDFERLWNTLDMDNRGLVDATDFFTFLSTCAQQFKEVKKEYEVLPKSEKAKLAARRLSNISQLGEDGVADLERRNNRRSRAHVNVNMNSIQTLRDSSLSISSINS